jgi:hypothetical protein
MTTYYIQRSTQLHSDACSRSNQEIIGAFGRGETEKSNEDGWLQSFPIRME